MDDVRLVTGACSLILLLAVIEMLRRRQLREKYAVLWLFTGAATVPLTFFPGMFDAVAHRLGVADPPNLMSFLGIVFLLLVCVHLSWEVSRLEEETRILAEEIALIRLGQQQAVDDG